jgi:hypothetical protein
MNMAEASAASALAEPKPRGRPPGSKNKRRGRPPGKGKAKAKRGRPPGSKNKARRGRPPGSSAGKRAGRPKGTGAAAALKQIQAALAQSAALQGDSLAVSVHRLGAKQRGVIAALIKSI